MEHRSRQYSLLLVEKPEIECLEGKSSASTIAAVRRDGVGGSNPAEVLVQDALIRGSRSHPISRAANVLRFRGRHDQSQTQREVSGWPGRAESRIPRRTRITAMTARVSICESGPQASRAGAVVRNASDRATSHQLLVALDPVAKHPVSSHFTLRPPSCARDVSRAPTQ